MLFFFFICKERKMLKKQNEDMIYIFTDSTQKVLIPFKGTEAEMLDIWDILMNQELKIDRVENVAI